MMIRTGFGYDVHRLGEGVPFMIAGVQVPFEKGAIGHSDADTPIHALCDALFGALALGDIGTHFPDSSEAYKGIDSKILLMKTMTIVRQNGYELGNADITICLQRPKIMKYIPLMRKTLSEVMGVDPGLISVKATTTEKLGFVGSEEGIAAYAVVLIEKQ